MNNHKDLKVWNDSVSLVKDIYQLTSKFPKEENYGLTNQIRKSSISIPSNLAEGAANRQKRI